MNADTNCLPDDDSPDPLSGFSERELRLLANYWDPCSPAYGNGTKAAELAKYKGLPGSNQLAVQACRTFAKARRHPGLSKLLIDTGCTLERALQRVSACLEAKNHRVAVRSDGEVVHVEAGDNYPVQLQAAKVIIGLHGVNQLLQQQPPPATDYHDVASASQVAVPDDLTAEQQGLQRKAKAMDPQTRMLTGEVIAAEEEVVRARIQLAAMEGADDDEAPENGPDRDEHLS